MDKKNVLMAAIAAALLIAGVGLDRTLLTENEFENAYICSVTEEVRIFYGGISGTAYTGYPNEGTRVGQKRCIDEGGARGTWISLTEYAEQNGLNPLDFIVQEEGKELPGTDQTATRYSCGVEECIEI